MVVGQRRRITRSKALLAWTALLFAASQLALALFLRQRHPEVRDLEYGSLLQTLRARLAEAPDRPLLLLLGSSRIANAVQPSAVPVAPQGPAPLVFNFAVIGAGPLRQLQMLRRLLAEGVQPTCVVAEVWPAFLMQNDSTPQLHVVQAEQEFILTRDLQWADLPLLQRHFANAWPAYGKLLEGECLPALAYGQQLQLRYSPFPVHLEEPSPFDFADPRWRAEGQGWMPAPLKPLPPELLRPIVAKGMVSTRQALENFTITPTADKAMHELIHTCGWHQMRLAFLLGPEYGAMRACYPPRMENEVAAYLGRLSREQHVPIIDTRDWVPDSEFLDMKHILPGAAGPYTQRLGREALLPLAAGRPLDPALLYPPPSESPWSASGQPSQVH